MSGIKFFFAVFVLYIIKTAIDIHNTNKPPRVNKLIVQINEFKNDFKGDMDGKKYKETIKKLVSRIERMSGKKAVEGSLFSEGPIMFT